MGAPPDDSATAILNRLRLGDAPASAELFPLVYDQLRGVAGRLLRGGENTLQPTALVNEAFLRLIRVDEERLEGRAHFFGVASKAMRQILVDHARARAANKRGGNWQRITISEVDDSGASPLEVLDLEAALTRLALSNERPARVAELRFFGGLDVEEVAVALGISPRTVKSDWRFARAWLRRALEDEPRA